MATQSFKVNPGIWQRVTDKGQKGTLWIKSISQYSILIDHVSVLGTPEDTIPEGSELEASVGISVEKSFGLNLLSPISISVDNVDDVYYVLFQAPVNRAPATVVMDVL